MGHAYVSGWNAYYFGGCGRNANPYLVGTYENEQWDRGWMAAEYEWAGEPE